MGDFVKEDYIFYRVVLKNVLDDKSKIQTYAILENDRLYDLLTNKLIVIEGDNYDSDYDLIGISKEECSKSEVSVYLHFLNQTNKDIHIERLNLLEKEFNKRKEVYKTYKLQKNS